MKNIILLVLFVVGIFIVNMGFYYSSPEYRDFLKKVKTEAIKSQEVEEDLSKHSNSSYFSWKVEEKIKEELEEKVEKNFKIPEKIENKNNDKKLPIKQEVKLWKSYQDILNIFSEYNLSKLEVNANLFDLTNQYPDAYYEFYSPKFTLYFFTTKSYEDIYDIFDVLQLELQFKLNPANNFWEKSFYINFDEDINDDVIRMVIFHKWIVFWLKVHKTEYNNIKQKLQNLRNN